MHVSKNISMSDATVWGCTERTSNPKLDHQNDIQNTDLSFII